MKISHRTYRKGRVPASKRTQLLAAFERSGWSAAAFARQHGLNYTTFCGWRQRRDKAQTAPAFVEVELPAPSAPVELCVELGGHARMRISSRSQIVLAAALLQALNPVRSC